MHSYPSVYNLGHKAIDGIFNDPILAEEKVDGSQFSFCMVDGQLHCRSKNAELYIDAPEGMFARAVQNVFEIADDLHPDWVYRGEYLQKSKHNVLAYDRVPNKNIIIFDIQTGEEQYLPYGDKRIEATRLGLETVPLIYDGVVSDVNMFTSLLDTVSILGGQKIEGIVVKNYALFTKEKKVAMGKYVSEKYREVAGGEWRKQNPTSRDIVDELIIKYRTPARWQKAVQHLRDAGTLEGSPRDIGLLIREVPNDVLKECEDEIKEALFLHFWNNIKRGITSGLPEWYKEELLKSAFEDNSNV